jgi:cysteinyl-tRNA synthetase
MIRLYDTQKRQKVEFKPLEEGKMGIYVCGPTVYDFSHVGHGRCYVAWDTIVRYFKYRGYDVTYVRNITDVDDKIINRANECGEEPTALAARFAEEFNKDLDDLGCIKPEVAPKVSEHIPEIISLIEGIIEAGHGYPSGNDVYFDVPSFAPYGSLSARNLDDLQAGARVEVNEAKKSPLDFALWKGAKPNEPSWDSPWGKGRPGWHIECSAMSTRYLGRVFDIHGGGMDLIFPHHENEVAQSKAACGNETFARHWMHNGFINLRSKESGEEKMSKSLGNCYTIRDICAKHESESLRLFFLGTNYRNPINFEVLRDGDKISFCVVEEAERRLAYGYNTLWRIDQALSVGKKAPDNAEVLAPVDSFAERFQQAMDDDFNTAAALGATSELMTLANKLLDQPKSAPKATRRRTLELIRQHFATLANVMGLYGQDPETFLLRRRDNLAATRGIDGQEVEASIAARSKARGDKDFAAADAIRQELTSRSIELMDSPNGTTWRIIEE